ncbi:MAG: zf-TFIIB domain-containing protein [Acutalibacteraceae bacterium]
MRYIMDKISRFMYGRYGTDKLNLFIFVLWFIVAIVGLFTRSIVVSIIELLLIVLIFFRTFSRNIPRRQEENRKFIYAFQRVKSFFTLQGKKVKDRKTHRYVKCPYCKAQLRVRKRKGVHTIRCPKCGQEFEKNILF